MLKVEVLMRVKLAGSICGGLAAWSLSRMRRQCKVGKRLPNTTTLLFGLTTSMQMNECIKFASRTAHNCHYSDQAPVYDSMIDGA
jgi:hypothetical protein